MATNWENPTKQDVVKSSVDIATANELKAKVNEKKAEAVIKTVASNKNLPEATKKVIEKSNTEKENKALDEVVDGKKESWKETEKKSEKIPENFKWIKNAEWKEVSIVEMKLMETDELLKIKPSDRINLVTIWNKKLNANELNQWDKLEFNFTFDWEKNKDLFLQTTPGALFPHDVWSIKSGGMDYTRHGLTWEFFNDKWERLVIDDGTKISINKKRNPEEVAVIWTKITKEYYDIIKNQNLNENDKHDMDRIDIIRESLMKWLEEKEINMILSWKYEDISTLGKEKQKEVFKILKHLENSWIVDSYDVIEKIPNIEKALADLWIPAENFSMWPKWYPQYTWWPEQTPPNINFPPGTPEQTRLTVNAAMWQLWVHENSGKADKFFHETGFKWLNARSTPWCAAFINWSLKQWGLQWTNSNMAKSFINWAWSGHVWFNVWGQLLWWNQSNRVSLKPLDINKVEWYVMPHEMNKKYMKWDNDFAPGGKIPEWAIVVFGRWKNTT